MTFDEYVKQWKDLCDKITQAKEELKDLTSAEGEMRQAISTSLQQAFGNSLKEGVNSYKLQDGSFLKYTHAVERKIDPEEIPAAREEYSKQNEKPVEFDDLLKVSYTLDKKNYDRLSVAAQHAISRMITIKPKTPTLEIK